MPSVELNHLQSALANAHGDVNSRITADVQRFQRYAAKRMARFQREGQNNQGALMRALSDSLGFTVPHNMAIDKRPDGSAVLTWDGPDPRVKAETPPSAPVIETRPAMAPKILPPVIETWPAMAPVEPAANGAHEHAPV